MYFLDEKQKKLVENCPSCQASFILSEGTVCPSTCPAKKLEIKHKKVLEKIVNHLLVKQKVKIECPSYLSAEIIHEEGWGWTDDVFNTICIPWWTLRSKREFLDTVIHELGHLKAYQKTFSLNERNILKKFFSLEKEQEKVLRINDFIEIDDIDLKIKIYYRKNKELIDRYFHWEAHDYDPWHVEYLKLYQKILTSPYSKYAYGHTKPRSHGFDKQGRGKYDRSKLFILKEKSLNKDKEIRELHKAWNEIAKKIKRSKKIDDQILYDFLETHYVDPQTCLITDKERKEIEGYCETHLW
jgi:hypothetical protein